MWYVGILPRWFMLTILTSTLVFVCGRYWLFSDVVPGLFIEKGWVHESIDYNYALPPGEAVVEEEDDGEVMKEDTEGEFTDITPETLHKAFTCSIKHVD